MMYSRARSLLCTVAACLIGVRGLRVAAVSRRQEVRGREVREQQRAWRWRERRRRSASAFTMMAVNPTLARPPDASASARWTPKSSVPVLLTTCWNDADGDGFAPRTANAWTSAEHAHRNDCRWNRWRSRRLRGLQTWTCIRFSAGPTSDWRRLSGGRCRRDSVAPPSAARDLTSAQADRQQLGLQRHLRCQSSRHARDLRRQGRRLRRCHGRRHRSACGLPNASGDLCECHMRMSTNASRDTGLRQQRTATDASRRMDTDGHCGGCGVECDAAGPFATRATGRRSASARPPTFGDGLDCRGPGPLSGRAGLDVRDQRRGRVECWGRSNSPWRSAHDRAVQAGSGWVALAQITCGLEPDGRSAVHR